MRYKIIADSSVDIKGVDGIAFQCVPLKIITAENEYVDNDELDTHVMIEQLKKYKGKSHSSCPNSEEWRNSFEDYDGIICVTITSGLSGSYNAARVALEEYLEEFPQKRGFVIDSLSTGPENALIVEKLCELIDDGICFEEVEKQIREYMKTTHLVFCLESLKNLANNGRVSPAVAKIAGILGIRIVGVASSEGTLEISQKARGAYRALQEIYKTMKDKGFCGGKIRIHHCNNESAAKELLEIIKTDFPNVCLQIGETGGLCSFYAEEGGLLVGFEG
ncbi:MAG: DegV family protein [Clostridia bacterium]|nr:DegV family protein [Clostridia bacterium]